MAVLAFDLPEALWYVECCAVHGVPSTACRALYVAGGLVCRWGAVQSGVDVGGGAVDVILVLCASLHRSLGHG